MMQVLAQRYQLLPDLSPEEYEALKADIAANGIQVPVEVDEEGHVLDGYHRLRAARELGIPEEAIPKVIRAGLTEQEKREHALRLNLLRRQLSREQKQAIAVALRQEGWTQVRIAQVLGVSQATVSAWLAALSEQGVVELPQVITDTLGRPQPARKAHHARSMPQMVELPEEPVEPDEAEVTGEPGAEVPEGAVAALGAVEPEGAPNGAVPSQLPAVASWAEPGADVELAGLGSAEEEAVEQPEPEPVERSVRTPEAEDVIGLDNVPWAAYLLACQPQGFPAGSRMAPEEYAQAVAFEAALNVLRHTYERADRGRQVVRAWKRWLAEQGREAEAARASRMLEAVSRWIRSVLGIGLR